MDISLYMPLYFTYIIIQGNFAGSSSLPWLLLVAEEIFRYYLPSSATACRFLLIALSFLHFYNLSFALGILMFCTKQVRCDRQERLSMRETY